jgi:hypothetical protein
MNIPSSMLAKFVYLAWAKIKNEVKRGSIRRIPIAVVSLHATVIHYQTEVGMNLITAREEFYWQYNRIKEYWRCISHQ